MKNVDVHQLELLLRRALSGDACAWNEFFREIRRYLHAEVRKVLGPGVQGPLDHSAIVQSTLRRVLERIDGQFPEGPGDAALRRFLGWVRTIVRNRTWQEWRDGKRQPARAPGSAIDSVPDPQPRERAVRRDQLAAALAAELARLPEKHRQVVELFWFERLSDAAISARLGCSAGAVRVLRCRALRLLRTPALQSLLEESHDGRC
jgi:RNA polymerase sigma factor (sigma-70 family)